MTEDTFRTDVKFRFGAAFIKYATAHPQPKPILRLHSPHKIKDLVAVAMALRPKYLRNKCPHGLGELAHRKDTLKAWHERHKFPHKKKEMKMLAKKMTLARQLKWKKEMEMLAKEMTLARQLKLDCPPPLPPSPKSVCSATFDYNPKRDDGHGQALPLNLTRKILRMREPFPSHDFKMKCEEYQQICQRAGGFASDEGPPPFKLHLTMTKRFKKIAKERKRFLKELMKEELNPYAKADTNPMCDTPNYLRRGVRATAWKGKTQIIKEQDEHKMCPMERWEATYGIAGGGRFNADYSVGGFAKWEHSRIAWLYEERRQLLARGLLPTTKLVDTAGIVAGGEHLGEFIIKKIANANTPPDHLCRLLRREGAFDGGTFSQPLTPLNRPYTATELLGMKNSIDKLRTRMTNWNVFRDENAVVICEAEWENLLSVPHGKWWGEEAPLKYIERKLCERARAPKADFVLTRKKIIKCKAALDLIKEAHANCYLEEIMGEHSYRKCLPAVIARFKEFDQWAFGCCRGGAKREGQVKTDKSFIRYTMEMVMSASLGDRRQLGAMPYHKYWKKATDRASLKQRGDEILHCDMALWRAYCHYNLNCDSGTQVESKGRMFCELRDTGRAIKLRTAATNAGAGMWGGAEKVLQGATLKICGAVLFDNTPVKSVLYAYRRNVSKDLRLPFMNCEQVDGVRYAEMDYKKGDLLKCPPREHLGGDYNRLPWKDDFVPYAEQKKGKVPLALLFKEHEHGLDGGNYYVRAWAKPTGELGLNDGEHGRYDYTADKMLGH